MAVNELPFRIALSVLLIVGWSMRISFTGKTRGVQRIHSAHERREKVSFAIGHLSYAPTLVYIFPGWLSFAHFSVPESLRWAGVLVIALGIWLLRWTHQALGDNWSGVLELSEGHELVTRGPYRFLRHPMYLSFFLCGAGISLLSANWLVGPPIFGAMAYMYLLRVHDEERMMIKHFGQTYLEYMAKTRRLLPRLPR